jgi:hypothetical protein
MVLDILDKFSLINDIIQTKSHVFGADQPYDVFNVFNHSFVVGASKKIANTIDANHTAGLCAGFYLLIGNVSGILFDASGIGM